MHQRATDRFDNRVKHLQDAIHERMLIYEQVLWGGVALFNSNEEQIGRDEFRKYVATLDLERHWPGIQGIGFSVPVDAKDKQGHVEKIRAEGFPTFTIRPEGNRAEYSSIIYLEPFDWRNKRAFGYDMWSNDMRRKAMKRARDLGVASTSGIITLVQETEKNVQKGFLTYLPVYAHGMATKTVQQRREAFRGWVYSPFRMGDLMDGILGPTQEDIHYQLFDSNDCAPNTMLFSSHKSQPNDGGRADFSKVAPIRLQGREWSVAIQSMDGYITAGEKNQPNIIAAVGIIIDILLFYVISSLVYLQKKAKKIADAMTIDLNQAKKEVDDANMVLETKINDLQDRNSELERFGEMTVGREGQMVDLKREINSLCVDLGRPEPYNLSFADEVFSGKPQE